MYPLQDPFISFFIFLNSKISFLFYIPVKHFCCITHFCVTFSLIIISKDIFIEFSEGCPFISEIF